MTACVKGQMLLVAVAVLALRHTSAQSTTWTLAGSGSTMVQMEMAQVAFQFMSTSKPLVTSSYRAVGSSGGRAEFVGTNLSSTPSVAYTVCGLPLPSSNYTAMSAVGGVLHVPLVVEKTSFYHSLSGLNQTLNLTACALAGIYSGSIQTWDHMAITQSNPGLKIAPNTRITVIRRLSTFSPTATSVVQYFASSCNQWMLGTNLATIPWPASSIAANEDSDMLNALSPTLMSPAYIPNAIGFIYSSLGSNAANNLSPVALQVGGQWQVAASADNSLVANAITPSMFPAVDANWGDFVFQTTLAMRQPTAWPLLVLSSAIVRRDNTWMGTQGGLLKAFLTAATSDPQQMASMSVHHIVLPATVRTTLTAAAQALLMVSPSAPIWGFELDGAAQPITGAGDYIFSAFRMTGINLAILQASQLNVTLAAQQAINAMLISELADAASTRAALKQAIDLNAANEVATRKAFQIAVAGIVIGVILAFVALVLAAVYVSKLKKMDDKYAKYLQLGKYMGKGDPDNM